MKRKKIALTVLLTLVLCLAVGGAALAMSSANYDLPWTVLSAGGGDRGSASYVLGDTTGQSSAIGLSQSTNYRLGSGYWYGALPEPPPPVAVGGEVSPINKINVLAPWLGLALILVIGGGVLLLRRREAN